MSNYTNLTKEMLDDVYEFNVLKKVIKRSFPWIKDIKIGEDSINKYSIIFLDFVIDPWELAKEKDEKVKWYVSTKRYINGEPFWSPYLASFFSDSTFARHESSKIERLIEKVSKSPAIPKEMKMPSTRKFGIGSFFTDPTSERNLEYTEEEPSSRNN